MVPFLDLPAQVRSLRGELEAAIGRVLDTCQFTLGSEVAAFEEEFARFVEVPHAIAVNNGTSALHLALLAAGVGPGDEVVTTPLTFTATVAAIVYTGATPVFAEVDPDTLLLDPDAVEARIGPKTKALLPVHLYGQCVDMDPFLRLADRNGVVLIEDAAQAHGARDRGRRAGSMGRMGCFSFYPGKNLGACGEGGAVTTRDPAMAEKIRLLRDWAQPRRYHHVSLGFNYRMEGFQGATLRVKLRHLEAWNEARRRHAEGYDRAFAESTLERVGQRSEAESVHHLYVVRHPQRDALRTHLEAKGIQSGLHYPVPCHLQPAYASLGHRAGDFPNAETAAAEVVSLPMFPELSEAQREEVVEAVRSFQG